MNLKVFKIIYLKFSANDYNISEFKIMIEKN